jgi:hypothetical protein
MYIYRRLSGSQFIHEEILVDRCLGGRRGHRGPRAPISVNVFYLDGSQQAALHDNDEASSKWVERDIKPSHQV